jgi:hypothetical protein
VAGGPVSGLGWVSPDDRVGERRVLAQRSLPHLRRIRLGIEAEPDLPADPRGQVHQAFVVRRAGDRLVQGVVSDPRVRAAAGFCVPLDCGLDRRYVAGVAALGRGPAGSRVPSSREDRVRGEG